MLLDDNSQNHGEERFPHPCKRPPRKCRQERFLRHFEMQSAGKLDNFCGGRNANTTYRCRPRFWSSVAGSGILGQGGRCDHATCSANLNYMHELSKGYMNKRRNEKTAQRRRRRRQGQKNQQRPRWGRGGGGERAVSGVAHARDEYGSIHCQEGAKEREGGGMRELAGRASSGRGRTEEAFDE